MSNPIYAALNPTNNAGNAYDLVNRFIAFKNAFSGDPRQMVMDMLQSGKIDQRALQQAQNTANQMARIIMGK